MDENISPLISKALTKKGREVKSVAEDYQSYANGKLLKLAARDKSIFVTKDKDFGELVFKFNYPHSGVILLRLQNDSIRNTFLILNQVLKYPENLLEKSFVVVTEKNIRIVKSPF